MVEVRLKAGGRTSAREQTDRMLQKMYPPDLPLPKIKEAQEDVRRQGLLDRALAKYGPQPVTKYDTSSLATPGGKENWVEQSGELPSFIRAIAHALMRSGHSKSSSIAIAVATVKRWAAGGGNVKADTRAKAAKAVAEWETLKAKAAAK